MGGFDTIDLGEGLNGCLGWLVLDDMDWRWTAACTQFWHFNEGFAASIACGARLVFDKGFES